MNILDSFYLKIVCLNLDTKIFINDYHRFVSPQQCLNREFAHCPNIELKFNLSRFAMICREFDQCSNPIELNIWVFKDYGSSVECSSTARRLVRASCCGGPENCTPLQLPQYEIWKCLGHKYIILIFFIDWNYFGFQDYESSVECSSNPRTLVRGIVLLGSENFTPSQSLSVKYENV